MSNLPRAMSRWRQGVRSVSFSIHGSPQPKGSTKAFIPRGWKRPIVTSTNPRLKGWEQVVAVGAQSAACGVFFGAGEPVRVDATFRILRPASVTARKRPHCVTRPDIEKLGRGLADALTGVLWANDSQVVEMRLVKRYAAQGEPAGVDVTVTEILPGG